MQKTLKRTLALLLTVLMLGGSMTAVFAEPEQAESYILTFNAYGGTWDGEKWNSDGTSAAKYQTSDQKHVTVGSTYGAADVNNKKWPKDPTREGYTFMGWMNGSEKVSPDDPVTITKDTSFTALWHDNNPVVFFDVNHDDLPVNLFSFKAKHGATSVNGGEFGGIVYSYNPATDIITLDGTATQDGTYFSLSQIAVDAGDYILSVSKVGGHAEFSPANSSLVFEPKMTGTRLTGSKYLDTKLVDNNTISKKITFSETGESNEITFWLWCVKGGSATFSNAQYKIAMYKASNPVTGVLPAGHYTVSDGSYGELPTAVRDGYTFAGWHVGSEEGLLVTEGSEVAIDGDHTLYAAWKAKTSDDLTLDPNGGTLAAGAVSYTKDGNNETMPSAASTSAQTDTADYDTVVIADAPTKEGYKFSGWTGADANHTNVFGEPNGSSTRLGPSLTKTVEDGYCNYKWVRSGDAVESNSWMFISFPAYSVEANEQVDISGYVRINPESQNYILLYHGDHNNDFQNGQKGKYSYEDTGGEWQYFHITRTFTQAYSKAVFEIYTGNAKGMSGTILDFDVKGVSIHRVGGETATATTLSMIPGGISTTAQWSPLPLQVHYDANGGSGTLNDQTLCFGEMRALRTNDDVITRAGYTFAGWNTKADGEGDSFADGTILNADAALWSKSYVVDAAEDVNGGDGKELTMYALWTANTYTLTFDLNGGKVAEGNGFSAGTDNQTKTVTYASTYGTADGDKTWPNDPTKTGFTFTGWKNGDAIFVSNDVVSITEDMTLTASYTKNSYTVTWVVDGAMTTETVPYGDPIPTPAAPQKDGFTFTGWTPAVPDKMPAKDLTFSAQFEPNTYIATLVADGVTIKTIEYTYGQKSISLPDVPAKEGYTGAWPTYTLPIGGVTITAEYTKNDYTVTWNVDGETTKQTVAYDDAIQTPADPQKEGYTFTGWTPAVPDKMPAKDLTFTAQFRKNPTVAIRNYRAERTVDFMTTLTFAAVVENPVTDGEVHWFVNGEDAGAGETLTLERMQNSFTVQAQYIAGGRVLAASETETVKVKGGFFQQLLALLRAIFNRLPVVVQSYVGAKPREQ